MPETRRKPRKKSRWTFFEDKHCIFVSQGLYITATNEDDLLNVALIEGMVEYLINTATNSIKALKLTEVKDLDQPEEELPVTQEDLKYLLELLKNAEPESEMFFAAWFRPKWQETIALIEQRIS